MSKSLRNIQGSKPRSSSTAFISLHFNKADEEQLEISYNEKAESFDNSNSDETSTSSAVSSKEKLLDSINDNDESTCNFGAGRIDQDDSSGQISIQNSRDSTPNRDSVVKDYWSRISKRASSLDSDLGTADQNEGWMFFKDIKGKLAKTLEERKQREMLTKSLLKESKTYSTDSTSSSFYKETDSDLDITPTEENKRNEKALQLSPAIEAPDGDNMLTEFDDYVEDKLEKAKCEILSSKTSKSAPNTQFFLQTDKNADTLSKQITEPNSAIENINTKDTSEIEKSAQNCNTNLNDETILEHNEIARENFFYKFIVKVKIYYYFVKSYWNSVLSRILIALLALCLVPVPSWFSGFIAGAFLSGYIVYCLLKPGKPKEKFIIPDFSQLAQTNIPVTEVEEPIIYKGWMNELPSDLTYNPDTYHVNFTRSIYIRLDGSYLRVSYPQNNIPKRAMFNEPRHERQFIYQQHYDITSASVELRPVGLARKRLWSKKYPICLTIPNPKQASLTNTEKDATDCNSTIKAVNRKESPIKKFVPRTNENNEIVLYLFSRTDREKDLWFNRFKKSSRIKIQNYSPLSSPDSFRCETFNLENKRTLSADSMPVVNELDSLEEDKDSFTELSISKQQKFELYMSHLFSPHQSDLFISSSRDKRNEDRKVSKSTSSTLNNMSWLNILIGRTFFDFLTEDIWAQCVAEKIQKKLSKIKLPVFLTELSIKDINLGTALPKIHRASEPTVDQKGLWVDIDLSYNGSFQMTLETKINLLRYKCDPDELSLSEVSRERSESINSVLRSPVYNSDEEDSAESSSDSDFPPPEIHETNEESPAQLGGRSTGKKLLSLVNRFAQSTYFQHAAKNKYIKKAMKDISNTPLVLTVEVQWLTGTLALNIPPMPTDRLWYGFRTNPHLSIVARPKLGHHVVTLTHVTEWIERKLVLEFQKLLVMPNMDDLIIPIMQPDADLPKA